MRRRRSPEVFGGRVTSAGAVEAGDGFSVQKSGAGTYIITLPPGFRVLSATATTNVAASAFPAVGAFNDNKFTVYTFVWNTAATAGDCPFSFTAIGLQQ